MGLTIGVPRETFPGERRVALTPRATETLGKLGAGIIIEESAGVDAGFPDQQYVARASRVGTRVDVFKQADIIVQVRSLGANPAQGHADLSLLRPVIDRLGARANPGGRSVHRLFAN